MTVKEAMKITGLSQPTICIWAEKMNQKKYGKHMWKLTNEFVDFLKKNVKPKNRSKKNII